MNLNLGRLVEEELSTFQANTDGTPKEVRLGPGSPELDPLTTQALEDLFARRTGDFELEEVDIPPVGTLRRK